MVRFAQEPERSLGRYQLLFMLGQGGMGEVHLAKLTGAAGFEKLCIVKTILPQMQADPQFVERFHHEARVLVQLNHSNIAQVYDMGEVDGTLYMAIEYVAGVDLSRVENRVHRQQAVVPIPIALYLAQQVAEALGYAHRKAGPDGTPLGIVHRDVSPQNVMVSYEGEVKVIDFGLAKSAVRSKHTLPQTVMGKLGYMSPEQAMAKVVDHRSDIFSAGIVAWEMLTGRPLYEGGTMGEMVAQMAHPSIESPRAVRPEISPALEQIIMRALQIDPVARYSRADEFARALNELAVREGLTVGAEEVGNYVRAMCPEEFAAERQLQSKLSMMRQKSGAEDERRQQWSEPEPEELGGTLVRPSNPELGAAEMTPAQRAISVVSSSPHPGRGRTVVRPNASPAPRAAGVTGANGGTVVRGEAVKVDDGSGPLVVPRSKAPLYGVLGALVLGALGVAAYSLLGGKNEPLPARVAEPSAGTGDEKVPTGEGPKDEEPRGELDAGSATARGSTTVVERREPGLGMVDVVGTLVPVRVDDDVVVVLVARGAKAPFEEGDAVLLVGEPTGKRASLYAHGTVVDVKPTLVKIMASDGNLGSGANLFALKDAAKDAVKRAPIQKTVIIAPPKRTSPPAEWKTLDSGGPSAPAPEPVHEPVAEAPRSVPPKSEAPKEVKNDAPARTASSGLRGVIGVSPAGTPGGQIVRIVNQSPMPLTGCIVRLASNRSAAIQLISSEVRLRYSVFHPDAKPPDPNFQKGWSAVYCREGTGYFFTTFGSR